MKSAIAKFIAVALFFTIAACNNKTEEKKEEVKTQPVENSAKPAEKEKTEISVGPGGAEVKTKDAEIKLITKDTTKK